MKWREVLILNAYYRVNNWSNEHHLTIIASDWDTCGAINPPASDYVTSFGVPEWWRERVHIRINASRLIIGLTRVCWSIHPMSTLLSITPIETLRTDKWIKSVFFPLTKILRMTLRLARNFFRDIRAIMARSATLIIICCCDIARWALERCSLDDLEAIFPPPPLTRFFPLASYIVHEFASEFPAGILLKQSVGELTAWSQPILHYASRYSNVDSGDKEYQSQVEPHSSL